MSNAAEPASFDALRRRAPLSRNPFTPKHLDYSPRWMAFGAGLLAGIGGAVAASPAPLRTAAVFARLAAAGGGLAALAGLAGLFDLRVERRDIPLQGLAPGLDGLRIGHLSDFHLGPWHSRRNLKAARAALERERPDLIALTGDFVDRPRNLGLLDALLGGLRAPLGAWACLGNHDYWGDPAAVARALHGLGIRALINEHAVARAGGAALVIAGVEDPWFAGADLAAALRGAPAGPVVLLAHEPDFIEVAAAGGDPGCPLGAGGRRIALQLSGHAHAGHVNLPGLGPLVVPRMSARYPRGLYRVRESWLYVHRGLGGLPVRIGAPPEVAILTLRRA